MPAYILADVTITDPEAFKEYSRQVPATIAAYGGKYQIRGGAVEVMEGTWNPKRLVVIEFESASQAKQWLDSPEYQPLKQMRQKASSTNMILIEGYRP